jgi:hypothetical protein
MLLGICRLGRGRVSFDVAQFWDSEMHPTLFHFYL